MRDREYNGWTNYDTWLVNLWMDESQEFFREQAEEIYGHAKPRDIFTQEEVARMDYADWLKDWHEDERPELPGVYGDLLTSALSYVNWMEIARHWIEASKEAAHA